MSTATLEAPKVQDDNDFLTMDLLSQKEMLALQANYDLNITGIELFNAETGETTWVYLIPGENVEHGLKRLEKFLARKSAGPSKVLAKDLFKFRVFAIKLNQTSAESQVSVTTLDQTPAMVLEDAVVLSVGRVHPNNPEWEGGLLR